MEAMFNLFLIFNLFKIVVKISVKCVSEMISGESKEKFETVLQLT